MSQVIYKGRFYTACILRDGSLVVTQNDKQRGKRVMPEGAHIWINTINGAVMFGNTDEAHALCRAVMGA